MKIKIFQIDAFAKKCFEGNSAAVCPLEAWLPDATMQAIAMENNLSETAFFVAKDNVFEIRWFTPTCEVNLCGHATLASAYVIFTYLGYEYDEVVFDSKSGELKVSKRGEWLEMDFPSQPAVRCETPQPILQAFEHTPIECLRGEDYIVVFDDEQKVLDAKPDYLRLSELDLRGVIITSKSKDFDFVNRFFAPNFGINEDPVTGSAFTQLVPYWESVLNKSQFSAKQVSKRGGEVECTLLGDRVMISGKAVTYMMGEIELNN